MGQSGDTPPLNLPLRLRLCAAWLAVAWERLWTRLWRPACILAFIAAVILTDVLPSLPGWIHIIVIAAAAGGLGIEINRALRGLRWPTWETAKARLEQTAITPHRPLTAAQDQLANEAPTHLSPIQRGLWLVHQERARAALAALRATWPSPGVVALDRYTLRAAAVVALFVAVAGSWGDMGQRAYRAAWPSWDDTATGLSVKVWITPPSYTGRSPIFVESPAAPGLTPPEALETPEHSKVLVVVTGTARDTSVAVDQTILPLEKLADNSQRLERELPNGDILEVRQRGRVLGAWRLSALPDLPPNINFVRDPREAGRWRLRLDYKASDDYGIESVRARILPATDFASTTDPAANNNSADETTKSEALEFDVTMPPFNPREATQASLHDLTSHPWAGQHVFVQLVVTDQAGQSSPSEFKEVILPERVFQHPIAKELIAIRKGLLTDPAQTIVPARRKLAVILQTPEAFGGDARVHLELATARYRLAYDNADSAAKTLPPILWAAAVRIEDGNLAVAEQKLDDAEKALKEAMERGAPAAEIARLIDQLQRAIAEYARELAARMPESELSMLKPESGQRSVGPEDLARLMEEMRKMNQMGAQDSARQMMAELQNMLQALRSASAGQRDNPDVKAAQEIMRDLKALTAEQSKLLDDTFKQARESQLNRQKGEKGESGKQSKSESAAAEQQEQLRKQLGELMGRMAEAAGQVPNGMGEAEGNMRDARDALKAGAWKPASDAEGQALEKLQDSMRQANDQLMQSLAEKGLAGMVPMPGDGQDGKDPLGQRNGPDDGTQVEIPDAPDANSMAERARAILEEIRQRASDRTRPSDEQDYLRRLMRQF